IAMVVSVQDCRHIAYRAFAQRKCVTALIHLPIVPPHLVLDSVILDLLPIGTKAVILQLDKGIPNLWLCQEEAEAGFGHPHPECQNPATLFTGRGVVPVVL